MPARVAARWMRVCFLQWGLVDDRLGLYAGLPDRVPSLPTIRLPWVPMSV